MAPALPHLVQNRRWAHLVLELPKRWQLLGLNVLVGVQDVVVGSRVVQEHWPLAELLTLVDAVALLGLGVCSVGLSLNLLRPCGILVDYLNLRDALCVKAIAVEDAVSTVDVLGGVVHFFNVSKIKILDLLVYISIEVGLGCVWHADSVVLVFEDSSTVQCWLVCAESTLGSH